ncbi:gluconokinase [Plesiomonas shigelloides]|uniref:gluconokinase n=1 Tax=Plesiomonas shigelloides TaxID=703 RepID=UPI001261E424|nr:gluconokinase [Plesiomonas shigelloides]KAB7681272.1 AAA family ATPase [Plesiomonas shigelloides]
MAGRSIIVMGVSACGKSSVGAALANALNAKFIDGDDLHPKANILKMSGGNPLNDDDRAPWLERIRDAVFSIEMKNETGIIVCSALKRKYRDMIREGNQNVTFVYLDGTYDVILERIRQRSGHFQKENMLQSQFETLECPVATGESGILRIDVNAPFDEVVERAVSAVKGAN